MMLDWDGWTWTAQQGLRPIETTAEPQLLTAGPAAAAPARDTDSPLELYRIPEGGRHANMYLLRQGHYGIIIDPSCQLPLDLQLQTSPMQPLLLLATHGHYDHIAQADRWRTDTGAPLLCHPQTQAYLADPALNLSPQFDRPRRYQAPERLLEDGDLLPWTEDFSIRVLHLPGHTGGDCVYLVVQSAALDQPQLAFTGDFLFENSVGRTDFPGGDYWEQQHSLETFAGLLQTWPDTMLFLPGHGPVFGLPAALHNPWLKPPEQS
ncbi:MAG: MBL fold metallo-hydrolase [Oscillospiraceae bacterium]|nr:MBL fold metallo-hydrolase [Oscillospiraceae bacterium]MDD4368387.1 MBL fold metallo-hydrolase [Oscillospiraceae bacterium]